jgi:Tol biopolymer transport system component
VRHARLSHDRRDAGPRGPSRWLLVFALALVGLVGCAPSPKPDTLSQGGGLPSLRRLDWGFSFYSGATWSPDGRWIALLVGPGFAAHLEVLSPDGGTKHDLGSWGCGQVTLPFSFAWLPDGELSCVTSDGRMLVDGDPFASPRTIGLSGMLHPEGQGSAWAPDGSVLIVNSGTLTNDPNPMGSMLFAVDPQGSVTDAPLTPPRADVEQPAWVPHGNALTYVEQEGTSSGIYDLWESAVTTGPRGVPSDTPVSLGTPEKLVSNVDRYYAWSPSGRWVAVRYGSYKGGDTIDLVDSTDPTRTVDVVLADNVGVQMEGPIWSPDGKTLIVFSVGYDTAQSYSIDVGAYLSGKGLQP